MRSRINRESEKSEKSNRERTNLKKLSVDIQGKKVRMKKKPKIKRKYIYFLCFVLIVISTFFCRKVILYTMGLFLVVDMTPEKSDMIVILRGDGTYSRTLEGATLFKKGLADVIFISATLSDNLSLKLKKMGVNLANRQEQLASILIQLGIPEEKIILDNHPSGGGTLGELNRIRRVVEQKKYTKLIVITSWYHTRRTYSMCKRLFKNNNLKFFVVAARDDKSSPSNWWRYRREIFAVLEEFPKLFFFYLNNIFKISFEDDPDQTSRHKQLYSTFRLGDTSSFV